MTAVDFPTPTPAPGGSPFDMIRRTRPDGSEYWSARDLMPLLGYGADWRNFRDATDREAHDLAHRDDEHDEEVAA